MGKRRLYRAARAAQRASPDVPPTWGERLAALRHVPPLVRLVFQTHRGYTIAILVLRAIRSLIPVAVLWIGKLIIDGVIYDHLERARRQTVGRIGLFTLLLGTAQGLITLISLASVLLVQLPWLLLLLNIAVLPAFLGEAHFASLGYSLLFRWT